MNWIGTTVKAVSGAFSSYFNYRKNKTEAIRKRNLAVIENQARLAAAKESHNANWELAQLANSDKWLRRISFTIFIAPIPIAMVDPELVSHFYETVSTIPEWNLKLIMVIIGGVWGAAELKNSLPALVSSMRKGKAPPKVSTEVQK